MRQPNNSWIISAILAFTAGGISRASTTYRENFPASGGMTPLSAVGWTAYYGNAGTAATPATPGSNGNPANAMLSGGPSGPTSGANINAGDAATSPATGFVPLLSVNGAMDFIAYTTEYTIDRSVNSPDSFSWYAASGYTGDAQRLVLRIGSQWYASTSPVAPPGGVIQGTSFAAAAQQIITDFSPAASAWELLNFTPGLPLTLGPTLSAPLPADNITAFGIYAEIADNTGLNTDSSPVTNERTFFDTFEVTSSPVVIPEPASLLLLAAPTLLAIAGRRSRS